MKLSDKIFKLVARITAVGFVLAALNAAKPTALASDGVPFRAAYEDEIQIAVEFPLAHISSTGAAQVTHLGQVTAQCIQETVNLVTGEGMATHRFVAANGDTILIDFAFTVAPTSDTVFAVTGTWAISDGTGRFEGASGFGTYDGEVDFTGAATALGRFAMEGAMSSVGSLK